MLKVLKAPLWPADTFREPSAPYIILIYEGKVLVCICISNSHDDIFICSPYCCYIYVSGKNKILVEAQVKVLGYLFIHPNLKNQREKN